MQRVVLLISRDESLSFTRVQVLERAGYRVITASNLSVAMRLASRFKPDIAILGHTFTTSEQACVIERLQETHPSVYILVLCFGMIHPRQLLSECASCFRQQPGCARMRFVEPSYNDSVFSDNVCSSTRAS